MDPSESRPSPRRELQLQGPRPTPLKVRKDSYMIKKPPIHPPHQPNLQSHQPQPQPHQRREPIIIYAVSPKVIHASAADFMSLVQRLTGPSPRAASAAATTDGAPSPAARLASVEHCARRAEAAAPSDFDEARIELGGAAPGILSPLPTCLPPISPSLFLSPVAAPTSAGGADGGSLGFLHELSPMFNNNFNFNYNYNNNNINNNNNRGIVESVFMPSPSNFMPSPSTWEFINQFSDF